MSTPSETDAEDPVAVALVSIHFAKDEFASILDN